MSTKGGGIGIVYTATKVKILKLGCIGFYTATRVWILQQIFLWFVKLFDEFFYTFKNDVFFA